MRQTYYILHSHAWMAHSTAYPTYLERIHQATEYEEGKRPKLLLIDARDVNSRSLVSKFTRELFTLVGNTLALWPELKWINGKRQEQF